MMRSSTRALKTERVTLLAAVSVALALVACTQPTENASSQAGADTTDVSGNAAATTRLRVVAANVTSGNKQSYDPGDGQRILQGLKPDVTLLQEFNYGTNSAADIRSFIDATFGTEFSYTRGASADEIPNGVISRYPILASGEWTDPETGTRGFQWAHIDIPGDQDLWAISVHLLTTSSSKRGGEGTALVSQIKSQVPAGDYVVLGGDFNTGSRTEACVHTLGAVLNVNGPFPVDTKGNADTSENRNTPHDWVLAGPSLDAIHEPVLIGSQSFPNGLVFDSRNYTPLADVAPVRQADSGSANMQHMAVVRDFALPVAPSTTPPAEDAGAITQDAGTP